MNQKLILGILAIVVVVIGVVSFSSDDKDDAAMMAKEDGDAMMKEDGSKEWTEEEMAMMAKEDGEAMMAKEDDAMMMKGGSYEAYSADKIANAANGDVVLFFHASWCPSCKSVDADIKANMAHIPSDLTILDIDYDKSSDLKKKYGVTSQHTFVQVDAQGNLIKKWLGSPTLAAVVLELK